MTLIRFVFGYDSVVSGLQAVVIVSNRNVMSHPTHASQLALWRKTKRKACTRKRKRRLNRWWMASGPAGSMTRYVLRSVVSSMASAASRHAERAHAIRRRIKLPMHSREHVRPSNAYFCNSSLALQSQLCSRQQPMQRKKQPPSAPKQNAIEVAWTRHVLKHPVSHLCMSIGLTLALIN